MFWKKKTTEKKPMFSYEEACRRESARVSPLPDQPLEMKLGELTASVLNISAGGFACRCPGQAVESGSYDVTLGLPGSKVAVSGQARIVKVDDRQICHGRFQNLTGEMTDAIHQYALEVQKEELRRKKAAAAVQD